MDSLVTDDDWNHERKIPFELDYTDLAAVDMTWPKEEITKAVLH